MGFQCFGKKKIEILGENFKALAIESAILLVTI
jgi:hypothetical protein